MWLGATSDEEFDLRNLRDKMPKDGQDRRNRLLVDAFVQGVDNNHCRNLGFFERLNDQIFHLVVQRFEGYPMIRPNQRDEGGSKFRVLARELYSESGENKPEVAPIVKIP